MKKITLIFLIIGILVLSAYLLARQTVDAEGFQPAPAKVSTLATKGAESPLDLRPALITKLQQLVKQGSEGLYNLSIHEIEPDVLSSSVRLKKIMIRPDSAVWKSLRLQGRAPADVFTIELDSLSIDGLGLKDIVEKNVIDLKSITVSTPRIEVYHDKSIPKNKDQGTLYQKIARLLTHLSVDKISVTNGSLVSHQPGKKGDTRLTEISVELSQILFDSTTQYDKSRFLFGKKALISGRNFLVPTANHLYYFKVGSFTLSATDSRFTAKNVRLQPLFSKEAFQKQVRFIKERYELSFAQVQLKNLDWWRLFQGESLDAETVEISGVSADVYLDRSLPPGPLQLRNFPHQLLMQVSLPIRVRQVHVHDANLSYQEYDPPSGQIARWSINRLQGKIFNLTNMPMVIDKNSQTTIVASGLFLNNIRTGLRLVFNMRDYRNGSFTASLNTSGFDGRIVNPLAEASGLFLIKRGTVQSMSSRISGNNEGASGRVLLLYSNLHITPLEKDQGHPGRLNKKNISSFIANKFLIRDENLSGGKETRNPDCNFSRDPHGSFFNLIWKTNFVGILKTIGAPEKLARKQ